MVEIPQRLQAMPKLRGTSEVAMQYRQSPRSPLSRPKSTATAEANSQHRSIKLEESRTPRSPLHESNKKKQGTQVAVLEAKLGEALEELKKLREQLEAVESSKLDVQQELEQAKKRIPPTGDSDIPQQEDEKEAEPQLLQPALETEQDETSHAEESESSPVTDVFEVVPTPAEGELAGNEAEAGEKKGNVEWEKEMDTLKAENERLKKELADVMRGKEEAADAKLSAMAEELRDSRALGERLEDRLEEAEGAKAALQEALKRIMVQSEQWRKAAETAVTELEIDGRGGRNDGGGGGSRMFVDLWKKKQHRET